MKIHYNSPVILSYAIISFVVLIIGGLTNHASTNALFVIYRTSPTDPLLYLRLFTYVLGHANFDHYFGNLTMLLLIGPMVEEKYGSKPILLMIIVTALIGGLSHIAFFTVGALGASGIVFMLILLTPFTNMRRGRMPLTFILVALIFIGREVIYSFTVVDNVSRFGHILGGISGAVMGMFINKKRT
ncbi:MAG: rhomboid family intramembrane serine protease [Defluviitaleaceae bacterium]|nr:rhomboid family intramembrane serine protease [Defluviitaleaceae bacterium]